MAQNIHLDVSQLEAPEPLRRILSVLPRLKSSGQLIVTHRREPCLLYPILEQNGFIWNTQVQNGYWMIHIRRIGERPES